MTLDSVKKRGKMPLYTITSKDNFSLSWTKDEMKAMLRGHGRKKIVSPRNVCSDLRGQSERLVCKPEEKKSYFQE